MRGHLNMEEIAIIKPKVPFKTEDEYVDCWICPLNSKRTNFSANISTDYFKYYYYGSTIEAIEVDKNNIISNIKDVNANILRNHNIFAEYALSFNRITE